MFIQLSVHSPVTRADLLALPVHSSRLPSVAPPLCALAVHLMYFSGSLQFLSGMNLLFNIGPLVLRASSQLDTAFDDPANTGAIIGGIVVLVELVVDLGRARVRRWRTFF